MSGTRPGSRLGGRYRLTERLAFGGMGEVWKGVDEVLGRAVAIKILRPELAGDNAFRRRFREEARTAGALSHPGIAAVYDYGESPLVPPVTEGAPPAAEPEEEISYLVMELVPGEALSAKLSREGALGTDQTLDLVSQTARALHAAHLRGVVHRDVKPANLMVTPERRVKVTDFGIARPQDHEPLTATGQVMGTAHYLAPELARGQAATPLSDVYALGVVAYECLAGRRPFEGDNQVAVATAHLSEPPPPLPETLSPEVRRIVEAAMEKASERRFQGADAFAAALESARYRLLSGQPPAAEVTLGDAQPSPSDSDRAAGTAGSRRAGAAGRSARNSGTRSATGRGGLRTGTGPGRSATHSGSAAGAAAGAGAGFAAAGGSETETPTTDPVALQSARRRTEPVTSVEGIAAQGGEGRRFRLTRGPLVALAALLVLVVTGAVLHFFGGPSSDNTNQTPPTSSPTTAPTSQTTGPVIPVPNTDRTSSRSVVRSTSTHRVTHSPTPKATTPTTTATTPTTSATTPTGSPTSPASPPPSSAAAGHGGSA